MCNFISICSDPGIGKIIFFDEKIRLELKENNPNNYDFDSHSSIADYFSYSGAKEDKLNKYEYCPFTGNFTIDQINNKKDDSKKIEKFCRNYDFSKIVESGLYNLNLGSLTKLPDGLKFPENMGYLNLNSLTELPENIKFPKSMGTLYLSSLTKLPDGLKFPENVNIIR